MLDNGYNLRYTESKMKTAISMPDETFKKAERVAKKLGLSRSQYYAMAIESSNEDFLSDQITQRLNEVYARQSSKLDPILAELQARSIPREHW